MIKDNKLPLYYKFCQLLKSLYRAIDNFKKQYKYSLGKEILELNWKCLDLIIEINALVDNEKHFEIKKLSIAFDQLKMRLRMAQELKQLSKKQYSHLQTNYIKEIGKMIGGWLRWSS